MKCARNYCGYGSICHFKCPRVVLARISDEVGTLCTVLLSVYSGMCLPIFTEIGSYLTDIVQKNSWHVFTALHCMQRGPSDRKSVRLSVRLSVTA